MTADVHRAGGDPPRLVERPPWSLEVVDRPGPDLLDELDREAAARGALDLRSASAAPGFQPLEPGASEHVRPVTVGLADVDATRALGRRLAPVLRPGDLLVLAGPLGAGKTTLTQGVGEGLAVRGRVTSPTFVLARVHRGAVPLVHVDAYRLRDAGGSGPLDLDDLDLDAALEESVTVVEWGDGVVEHLSAHRLEIRLDRDSGGSGDGRTVRVTCRGRRWAALGLPEPP